VDTNYLCVSSLLCWLHCLFYLVFDTAFRIIFNCCHITIIILARQSHPLNMWTYEIVKIWHGTLRNDFIGLLSITDIHSWQSVLLCTVGSSLVSFDVVIKRVYGSTHISNVTLKCFFGCRRKIKIFRAAAIFYSPYKRSCKSDARFCCGSLL
jgi:hypothetical protein